jgi:hypothetical protein
MSGTKTCPLCDTQRWKSDGKIVIEQQDLADFRLFGYTIMQLKKALDFARSHGWSDRDREGQDDNR